MIVTAMVQLMVSSGDLANQLVSSLLERPILVVILVVLTVILYKLYHFNELIVHIDEEVPRTVRVVANQRSPPYYPNGWLPVCESHLLQVNQVKSVQCVGQMLAVVRGAGGVAYVMDAYCPHLGADLTMGGVVHQNSCQQDCIRCPFHGWSFRTHDGTVSNVPYEPCGELCGFTI